GGECDRNPVSLYPHDLACALAVFVALHRHDHRADAFAFEFDDFLARRRGAGCCRGAGEYAHRGESACREGEKNPFHLLHPFVDLRDVQVLLPTSRSSKTSGDHDVGSRTRTSRKSTKGWSR